MKVILSPIASDRTTTVEVNGLSIVVDGKPIDLSVIPEGGYAEPDENSPFIGKVTQDAVKVRYHYDMNKAEPDQSKDWADYTFQVSSGPVPCPIKWRA